MPNVNIVERSENVLGGTPVFKGTRVPVCILIDYLDAGERVSDFLEDFPTVTREQASQALDLFKEVLVEPSG